MLWLDGDVAPAAALEWLVNPPEDRVAPDALTQLALISALRKCGALEAESKWGVAPRSLAGELLALQAAGPRPNPTP